jgi:hypothetical protein
VTDELGFWSDNSTRQNGLLKKLRVIDRQWAIDSLANVENILKLVTAHVELDLTSDIKISHALIKNVELRSSGDRQRALIKPY